MLRRAAVLLLAVCSAFAHAENDTDDTLARARSRAALDIAVYDNFPPFSYRARNGELRGLDVELARALAAKLGIAARLRTVTADETVSDDLRNNIWKGHYLGGGVVDVMMHVPTDGQFARNEDQSLLFGTYLQESIAVVSRAGTRATNKIAVEVDSISDYQLSSGDDGKRQAAIRKKTLADAVAAMLAGEADAVMGPKHELQGLLAMQGSPDVVFHEQQLAGLLRGAWNIGIAVKTNGGASLQQALDQALDEMRKDGSLATIFSSSRIALEEQHDPVTASIKER
ncbi:substrate-binding periplasmic protein [Steroidobacter sp.]|uniref:substrate-binding periplasmic protein n=1 Tax=Steroidobacter sp. TaxID=1978227 RepID=UPI001A4D1A90|nr:transporter substrate-binding domain-containing protein [Steroidobacter sp.]MBL8269229.1 transporter substrate-binding domain-containing protein [Steroidobacter sp.]